MTEMFFLGYTLFVIACFILCVAYVYLGAVLALPKRSALLFLANLAIITLLTFIGLVMLFRSVYIGVEMFQKLIF